MRAGQPLPRDETSGRHLASYRASPLHDDTTNTKIAKSLLQKALRAHRVHRDFVMKGCRGCSLTPTMAGCGSRSSAAAASAATSAAGSRRPVRTCISSPAAPTSTRCATHGLRIESPNGNLHLPRVKATDDPADDRSGRHRLLHRQAVRHRIGARAAAAAGRSATRSSCRSRTASRASTSLTRAVGQPHVAGGTAYVAAVIAEPGVIRHTAMDHLIFGPSSTDRRSPALRAAPRRVPAAPASTSTLSDRIQVDIWTKFVRLSVFSGMTARHALPDRSDRRGSGAARDAQGRACARRSRSRARKAVPLPASTFAEDRRRPRGAAATARKSSMLEDLERGRPLELPWLSGAVVRIGDEVGVATPTHRLIVSLLSPHVNGRR